MKKKQKIYLIGALVVFILLGSFLTLKTIQTNNFKKNLNQINEKLLKSQDNFVGDQKILNKPMNISAELTSKDVSDEKINIDASLDLTNDISEFKINPSTLNLTNPIEFYIHGSRKFVKAPDILSKMYEVSIDRASVSCDNSLECNSLSSSLRSINLVYPKDTMLTIINHSKDLFNHSIGIFDLKKTSSKDDNYNQEYTYPINQSTLKKLRKNFNKDTELKKAIYIIFKDYLNNASYTEDNIDEIFTSNLTGYLKVYTSKNGNKKYEIKLDNLFTASYEEHNTSTININLLDNYNISIELDNSNNKIYLNIDKQNREVLRLTLDSKDILNISGKLTFNSKEYNFTSENTISKEENNSKSGNLKIKLNNHDYEITYQIEYLEELEKSLVDNYANYTDISKEEYSNITKNALELMSSKLIKEILNF